MYIYVKLMCTVDTNDVTRMSRGSIEYSFVVNKNRIERAGKKMYKMSHCHCIAFAGWMWKYER